MQVIRYTTTHATFDGAMDTKDILSTFPDFLDWNIEMPANMPYIELHCYLLDDGSEVLPGNCERVEYPCDTESSVLQSVTVEEL